MGFQIFGTDHLGTRECFCGHMETEHDRPGRRCRVRYGTWSTDTSWPQEAGERCDCPGFETDREDNE